MLNFERSSLNQKLTIISFLSTGTALLFVLLAFAVISVLDHRKNEAMQLSSFAGVIGSNCAAALVMNERNGAEHTLSALNVKQEVATATLFDGDGEVFARYVAAGRAGDITETAAPPGMGEAALAAANAQGSAFWRTRMRVYRRVSDNHQPIGMLMIEADLSAMWFDIIKSLGMIAVAMGCALRAALLLASRFESSISDPVIRLIKAAQHVSASQNYTMRIAHQRSDELGTLINSFNDMLAQIEGRGAALAHQRDELERQVKVRTEQLEKAKNAAEAASQAKSAFLATMSHEIRTPMNGVLGMTDMLLGTALSETQRTFTALVKSSGEHLMVIINDILDFSKIEAGKMSVETIHFNLGDLLDDIHSVYARQAMVKGIAFDVELADNLPLAIFGDPHRLRQVIANLLGNAVKFTGHGRILAKVQVEREDAQQMALRFEVHDTGIGVLREARARIFEPFSQADGSTTRQYGGTGLGLAIAKQLVELMGGAIGVEHAPSHGALFWFTVSFDKRQVDPEQPGFSLGAIKALRVLIVDEQRASCARLEHQLRTWQVQTVDTSGALQASARLVAAARAGQPYEMTIVAMDLARTSGLALAAAIKADPLTRATGVVLLGAARLAADSLQLREAGVACQLIEPVRPADLFEVLAKRRRKGAAMPAMAPLRLVPKSTNDTRLRTVLLVEDNPVNVEVATAMLGALGLAVRCAHNGEQALQAVRTGHYDALLMDCQMPVMDGFAATAEIRRYESAQQRTRSVPIIAITANALRGDLESCLAAGMDDYLSKPFSQQQLGAVLSRWIALPPAAGRRLDQRREAARAIVGKGERINLRALDNIRAIAGARGGALVRRVIDAYLSDTTQHLQTLRSAIARLDSDAMRSVAHRLKSGSANVGADQLAQLCSTIEQIGRAGSTDGAGAILARMEQQFDAVRHALGAILEKEQ